MKKVLRLVVFMFVFFAGMDMVMAQAPKSDGYIKVITATRDNETTTYLYSKTETIQTLNGISYDEQSNILTLNNYSAEGVSIQIHNMGDFKINVIGSNIINDYITPSASAIEVTGNNSTTVYGGGSISFSGYILIKTDTGVLNIDNVSLSNKVDGNGNLIISEGKVNIENSTLVFDFFYSSYSSGIVSYDDITIKNSNISGNAGNGIGIRFDEKGDIFIINSTIDITVAYYAKVGIFTENNLNIENSTIKTKDGSISGADTTNISNSNIDIKFEDGDHHTIGIDGLNLNINDSNLNIDTAGSSCVSGKDIIINGGTIKLKSSDIGIRTSNFYDDDNPTSNLTIKKGKIDITALMGIGFDSHYDEGVISGFTMENGKLVIKSPMGIYVSNANFKGGYVEIDASNKDGIFDDNLAWVSGTVFALESINLASNIEISDNARIYKLDDGQGNYIYYLNNEEVEYDEEKFFSKPLLKNVIIKDKNYKEEEITTTKEEKNVVVENPKTEDIKVMAIILIILGLTSVIFVGYKRLRKIK